MKNIIAILLIASLSETLGFTHSTPLVKSIYSNQSAHETSRFHIQKTLKYSKSRSKEPPTIISTTSLKVSNAATAAGWIGTSIAGGLLGVPAVARATKTWYRRIQLPDWTPPDKIFGPVWTTLYSLIGYSFHKIYLIHKRPDMYNIPASLKVALAHYVLNISWPFIFFGMKKLRAGYIINLTLVASLIGIIPMFYQASPFSASLLLPYLVWLVFATKLNQTICKLNPTGSEKGYNNAMLQADIYKLQIEAGKRVGL